MVLCVFFGIDIFLGVWYHSVYKTARRYPADDVLYQLKKIFEKYVTVFAPLI